MLKKMILATVVAASLIVAGTGVAQADGSWTGEVIDHACFVKQGAHGEDHAGCAARCLKNGGQVGLLTADGEVFILKADAEHAEAFEALKAMAAQQAVVSGEVAEEDGMMVITVTKVEAATT
jgi:hypothetical protein